MQTVQLYLYLHQGIITQLLFPSMVNTCWLFASTFPLLTNFSTFNLAMVDFNSFLSMITKGLKATWQLFSLMLQNQDTKWLYSFLYFCPSVNFIKNILSVNIQPVFTIKLFLLNLITDQFFSFLV